MILFHLILFSALKHSPSKRTKSVKKQVSHQDGTTGAPPYKEGDNLIFLN